MASEQELLFPDATPATKPAVRTFVFEGLTEEDLFERSTGVPADEAVEAAFWRAGYAGTLKGRVKKAAEYRRRLLDRFLDEADFATTLAASSSPRDAAIDVVVDWIREDRRLQKRQARDRADQGRPGGGIQIRTVADVVSG